MVIYKKKISKALLYYSYYSSWFGCHCNISIARRATQLADRGHTAKQKKPLYSGPVAHMKNVTENRAQQTELGLNHCHLN